MLTLQEELELTRKGKIALSVRPEFRKLIGIYQQREGIHTEAEAARQILAAGLIAAEVFPD